MFNLDSTAFLDSFSVGKMSINSALRTSDCGHLVKVDIHLRNSPLQGSAQTYVQSFATGETIEGIVSIFPQDDLAFDKLHISFT
ncbi:hypothetical protein COL922a_014662, partial [Colletotrichum nupharicola]